MRKFIILDPSLRDERGHHFDLSQRIAAIAAKGGFAVHVFANERLAPHVHWPDAAIHRLFDFSNYQDTAQAGLDYERFAQTLHQNLTKIGAGQDAIILCHTCDVRVYWGAYHYIEERKNAALPLHLSTPYDEGVMPGNSPGNPLAKAAQRLRRDAAGKVFLWAETVPLANHLTRRWNAVVEPLPLPVPEGQAPQPSHSQLTSDETIWLSYLGAAREEKGFCQLPDLIRQTLDRPECERIRFFVQGSPQIVGYSPVVKAALEQIEALEGDRVVLQKETMSSREYAKAFARSHGLLLLYDRAKYAVRGSGIAWDAALSGKVLIGRTGTIVASFGSDQASVLANDIDGWIDGLADFCARPEPYQAAAGERSSYLREFASPAKFLRRLTGRKEREMASLRAPFATLGLAKPLLAKRLPQTADP